MLNLQRGLKNDRLLRALTGLNRKAFEELKSAFEQELSEEQVPRRSQEERKRVPGAGRKPRLETVEKKLIDILFYFKGKKHDQGILNQEEWVEYIPEQVKIQGDLGFQGLQNEYENVEIPHKKLKGGELTEKQRKENRNLASERVVCEHGFAGVKRYGIVANVYVTVFKISMTIQCSPQLDYGTFI